MAERRADIIGGERCLAAAGCVNPSLSIEVTMRRVPEAPPMPSLRRRFERYAIAYAAAYPIAFVWAAASIPLCIHIFFHELLDLQDDMPAVGRFVVHRIARPAAAAFALPHLVALPWAFGGEKPRWRRVALFGIGGEAIVGALFGAVSWLWLVLRQG
jgi:hypothetical protein